MAAKTTTQTHRTMTKIGVWTVITRYKPGSDKDDEDDMEGKTKALVDKDEFRIMEISKSAVVCYYGRVREERRRIMGLQDFVEKQMELGRREGGFGEVYGDGDAGRRCRCVGLQEDREGKNWR